MGEIAREIGVSTVYYSDVEQGEAKAFPVGGGSVDFEKLATALGGDSAELRRIAALERGIVEFDVHGLDAKTVDTVLLFAERLRAKTLTSVQVAAVHRTLHGSNGKA